MRRWTAKLPFICAAAGAAACSAAPGELRFGAMLAQTILVLVAVAALAVATLRMLAGRGVGTTRGADRRLEVLERLPIGARESVLALRAGQVVLIVSQGPRGTARLAEVPLSDWEPARFSEALAALPPALQAPDDPCADELSA